MRSSGKAYRKSSSCWSVNERDSTRRLAILISALRDLGLSAWRVPAQRFAVLTSALRQLQIFDLLHEFARRHIAGNVVAAFGDDRGRAAHPDALPQGIFAGDR